MQTQGKWQCVPFWSVCGCDNSCRTCLLWLSLLGHSGPEGSSPTEAASTMTRTYLLYPGKDHSLCLLLYLYVTASPLCLTICSDPVQLYNKHAVLPGCYSFSHWESRSLSTRFLSVFVCFILFSFPCHHRKVCPWSHAATLYFLLLEGEVVWIPKQVYS